MKKYSTRPIDFTGCHPVIAEYLKRNEAIKCRLWNNGEEHDEVKDYVARYEPRIYITSGVLGWDHAEPIPIKVKRIMPPERAIPALIAEGWRYDENGVLLGDPPIIPPMFKEMGGPIDNSLAVWPSCIIEEVEDDE